MECGVECSTRGPGCLMFSWSEANKDKCSNNCILTIELDVVDVDVDVDGVVDVRIIR